MTDVRRTPKADGPQPKLGWALTLISVTQLMVVLDSTVSNIALPFIGRDLGIDRARLTWIITGYALAFGGLLLLGGRLGDIYGRRRVLVTGLTIFAAASLMGGVAMNELMLLGSRTTQGIGAALAAPSALALITTMFPAGPLRHRAFAVYAGISAVGAAIGLLLGGYLTGLDHLVGIGVQGWRLTFLINVPIGAAAAVLVGRVLPESETRSGELDLGGAVTGSVGVLCVVYGLTRAGQARHGWADPMTLALLVAGLALLAVFVMIESRVGNPLLPLRILRDRSRATSLTAMALVPAAMFSMFFFLTIFLQQVMGYSPLRAGMAFLPFSVGVTLTAALISRLTGRIDPRFIAGSGALIGSAALYGLSGLSIDDRPAHVVHAVLRGVPAGASVDYRNEILPYIVLMSIGMGMLFIPLTATALHRVGSADSGVGAGVLNAVQQVGGALGLAALGSAALHVASSRSRAVAGSIVTSAQQQSGEDQLRAVVDRALFQATFTDGATHAFLLGSAVLLLASVAILFLLDVGRAELATDGTAANGTS